MRRWRCCASAGRSTEPQELPSRRIIPHPFGKYPPRSARALPAQAGGARGKTCARARPRAPPEPSEAAADADLDLARDADPRFGRRCRRAIGAAGSEKSQKQKGGNETHQSLTVTPIPAMEVETEGATRTPSGVMWMPALARGSVQPETIEQRPRSAATFTPAAPSSARPVRAPVPVRCRRSWCGTRPSCGRRGPNRPPA